MEDIKLNVKNVEKIIELAEIDFLTITQKLKDGMMRVLQHEDYSIKIKGLQFRLANIEPTSFGGD